MHGERLDRAIKKWTEISEGQRRLDPCAFCSDPPTIRLPCEAPSFLKSSLPLPRRKTGERVEGKRHNCEEWPNEVRFDAPEDTNS